MKYSEAAELIEELIKNEHNSFFPCNRVPDFLNAYLNIYKAGMEDIIRVLCDKGVIDNSEELEREKEGGY